MDQGNRPSNSRILLRPSPSTTTLEPQYVTNFFPLTHNSIFPLDADERITPELAEEIMTLFRSGQPAMAAYEMPQFDKLLRTWLYWS